MTNDCQLLMAPVPLSCKPGAICDANDAVYLNHDQLSNVRKRFCVSKTKVSDALKCLKETNLLQEKLGKFQLLQSFCRNQKFLFV